MSTYWIYKRIEHVLICRTHTHTHNKVRFKNSLVTRKLMIFQFNNFPQSSTSSCFIQINTYAEIRINPQLHVYPSIQPSTILENKKTLINLDTRTRICIIYSRKWNNKEEKFIGKCDKSKTILNYLIQKGEQKINKIKIAS